MFVTVFVGFGIGEEVLKQCEGLRQVLVEAAKADGGGEGAHADAVVACQLVEFLFDFADAFLVSADILQVIGAIIEVDVALFAHVELESEIEQAVLVVVLVEQRQTALGRSHGEVLGEVEEARFDGPHIRVLDFIEELAAHVAVGGDGGDFWFVDFHL